MKKLLYIFVLVALAGAAIPAFAEDPPQFMLKWGSQGSGEGQFNYPVRVAVDASGNVYAADCINSRVQKFTADGVFVTQWHVAYSSTDGSDNQPFGITVDPAGNVYVTGMGATNVIKYTSSGTWLLEWGSGGSGDGQFRFASGIASDGDGNIYVSDYANSRIQKFTSTGTFITKWSTQGQAQYPYDVAVSPQGTVYAACDAQIQGFTDTGAFRFSFGEGRIPDPVGLACDQQSNVYVVDHSVCSVRKFSSNGAFVTEWGSKGSGDGQFLDPFGVAASAGGDVYVADSHGYRIQKFGPVPTPAKASTWGHLKSLYR